MSSMRELELAVVEAATRAHRGCAPETCGGSRLDPCRLGNALEALRGEHESEPARWTPATWAKVIDGDRVRLNGQEATVSWVARQEWHADTSDQYRPKRWDHTVMRVKLTHLAEPLNFPAGDPVEILTDSVRRAALVLGATFPGTTEIKEKS